MNTNSESDTSARPHDAVDVFVTVGTDHHAFDRLVEWVDDYVERRTATGQTVRAVCQVGTSHQARVADSMDYVKAERMAELFSSAAVVVSHGGPATIMEARQAGRRPIVVPRDPERGEHVDGHQQRFAAFLAERDQIDLATTRDEFERLLDLALSNREGAAAEIESGEVQATVERIEAMVADLLVSGERPGRRRLGRRFRRDVASSPDTGPRVMVPTSGGGHLAQCWNLMPWLSECQRSWVVFDSVAARSLLADEDTAWAYQPTTRNVKNLVRNTFLALSLYRRFRPDVIISTGAGVAVPFFWLSRVFGAVTVFVEVYDRIDSATLTGRLVRPVTDLVVVQWSEQQQLYRDSVIAGPLL